MIKQQFSPNILLLNKASKFVNDLLKIFGVIPRTEVNFLGTKHMLQEQHLGDLLDILLNFVMKYSYSTMSMLVRN